MKPPCRKNGTDCPLRRAGCQARCKDYKAYREEQDGLNARIAKARETTTFFCTSKKAQIHNQWIARFKGKK